MLPVFHTEPLAHSPLLDGWQTLLPWLAGLIVIAGLAWRAKRGRIRTVRGSLRHGNERSRRYFVTSISTLARLSMAGALAVGLLGLLNFPTSCRCGADLPHDHSLFQLAGHRHHQTFANVARTGNNDEHIEFPTTGDYDGPTVQSPGSGISSAHSLAQTGYWQVESPAEITKLSTRSPATALPAGQTVSPDLPPPRHVASS